MYESNTKPVVKRKQQQHACETEVGVARLTLSCFRIPWMPEVLPLTCGEKRKKRNGTKCFVCEGEGNGRHSYGERFINVSKSNIHMESW